MTTESLTELFRAFLDNRELTVVDGLGKPLSAHSQLLVMRELADIATEVLPTRWDAKVTREIPKLVLDKACEEARVA